MTARRLSVHETLPTDLPLADVASAARAATERLTKRLNDHAQQYVVTGWAVDDDGWEGAVTQSRPVQVWLSMRLTRE